jgi:hypothetical protein
MEDDIIELVAEISFLLIIHLTGLYLISPLYPTLFIHTVYIQLNSKKIPLLRDYKNQNNS